jgi:hypothetical protein
LQAINEQLNRDNQDLLRQQEQNIIQRENLQNQINNQNCPIIPENVDS